ncbi:MAG: sulfurtransferase TusA family protein [Dehalococcoidales bacterium]|nr:sulfurtransferase TusA family protein [Dehalococcoidales bacterium]MDD5604643.1 sulfurtransferase TusA family protein [Dehalococcoidales bacterium]NLE90715.1 sulfurtransferase TusA family protein [Dehalococcoidales bacterium]
MSEEIEKKLDVRGQQPPTPNMMLKDALEGVPIGALVEVTGDKSASRSLQRFVRMRGHETVSVNEAADAFIMVVKKVAGTGDLPLDCILIKD